MNTGIRVLISEEDIKNRIVEMAEQINTDYEGKIIHMICVLNGGMFFMCELAKHLTVPVTIDSISVSSYGDGTESSRNVKIVKSLSSPIEGRDVIVVDDIIDTGRSLKKVLDLVNNENPSSLGAITLLDKPERREVDVEMYLTGFKIPNEFAVGYGLDYAQKYRNLPYVGVMNNI